MNLYIDGVLVANETDGFYATPNAAPPINYRIGFSDAVGSTTSLTYFQGYLDDLALFRGVLSIGQIREVR